MFTTAVAIPMPTTIQIQVPVIARWPRATLGLAVAFVAFGPPVVDPGRDGSSSSRDKEECSSHVRYKDMDLCEYEAMLSMELCDPVNVPGCWTDVSIL